MDGEILFGIENWAAPLSPEISLTAGEVPPTQNVKYFHLNCIRPLKKHHLFFILN
jgi:hypothetical protein